MTPVDELRPEALESARAEAAAHVAAARPAVERRFAVDWGLELPDSIFTFWEFVRTADACERGIFRNALDVWPDGIMDLFEDPQRQARDGLDVRVHMRYYRDPPEFLTFMHGFSDGLHFGLWFDDGRRCTGVASYYNNDGGGVGLPQGTPLDAVREVLGWCWRDVDDYGSEETEPEQPHRLRLLGEILTMFESLGDHRADAEERLVTLDGAGALVRGATEIPRHQQPPWDDDDLWHRMKAILDGDPAVLAGHVAHALSRCAAGHPADALALGRDLHWASGGDPILEQYANELLEAAYRALGRDALAAIAQAHHRHRKLSTVDVLARRA